MLLSVSLNLSLQNKTLSYEITYLLFSVFFCYIFLLPTLLLTNKIIFILQEEEKNKKRLR